MEKTGEKVSYDQNLYNLCSMAKRNQYKKRKCRKGKEVATQSQCKGELQSAKDSLIERTMEHHFMNGIAYEGKRKPHQKSKKTVVNRTTSYTTICNALRRGGREKKG